MSSAENFTQHANINGHSRWHTAASDKIGYPHNIFSYFFTKTYVVGAH